MGFWSRLLGRDKEHNAKMERKAELKNIMDASAEIGNSVQKSIDNIAATLLNKIRDFEAKMKKLDIRLKTEKIYKLNARFYLNAAKKRGKLVIQCNSEQFLDKLREIIKGT